MSSGLVGDQAVSSAVAGADVRSPQDALLDAVILANLWGWADPSGVGAAVHVRPGNTMGTSQDPKCCGLSLGTASEVVANLGITVAKWDRHTFPHLITKSIH